jgi:hypothetical protein
VKPLRYCGRQPDKPGRNDKRSMRALPAAARCFGDPGSYCGVIRFSGISAAAVKTIIDFSLVFADNHTTELLHLK